MIKKGSLFFLLLGFVILVSSCETTKGLVKDTKDFWQATAKTEKALTKGVAEGTKNLWQAAAKADNWMKENLW